MKRALIFSLIFCAGALCGWRATWAYMQHVWKTNPYAFKFIVEGVIRLREEKARRQTASES